MNKYLTVLFLSASSLVHAQQRPLQSLYMFDPLLVNPAYAGSQVQLSATAIYRNQWVNLDGAPKTFTQTVHSGFRKYRVGLGFILSNDQIGIHNDVGFYGVYSYKLPINKKKGMLSFGLQGGFNNLRSNYALLDPKNPSDPYFGMVSNKFNPNVGAGIYFRQSNFYVGFSVPYILNNKVVGLENLGATAKQHRYYYLMGGFTQKLSNIVKFAPSTLIKVQDDAPFTFDLNAFLVFYDAVGLGCSYRFGDSIIPMFELQLNNNFHVGYAYDITTSALNQYSNGSHEIMINYRVKIQKIHKGLECPTYW
ncbi:MAG: type IX secretion system membrane protein PorP/SprF [Bacteroidetes bacterium]|nr:type IX secretion system membrane protein PorP/SprF [Bacteroidota bacterium]